MTAHFSHPLTNAQRQALHRAKVKLKLARLERYEAALKTQADWLEEIAHLDWDEIVADGGVTAAMVIQQQAGLYLSRARNALNAEAEA